MSNRIHTRKLNKIVGAGLLFVATLAMLSSARADGVTDTVMLANGGRIRGTVMEEDPQKGVTIKLVDGTVRKLTAKEVKQVRYGSDAATPAAPPPSTPQPDPSGVDDTLRAALRSSPQPAPPQPVYQTPPQGSVYPGMTMPPNMVQGPNGYMMMVPAGRQPMVHQSPGMYGGGLALTIIGAIALPSGLVTAIAGALPVGGCSEGSLATECYAGGVLIGLGVLGLAIGIPMTVIGGQKVPADSVASSRPWWQPASFDLSPAGSRVEWAF